MMQSSGAHRIRWTFVVHPTVAAVSKEAFYVLDTHDTERLDYAFDQCLFRARPDHSQQLLNLRERFFEGIQIGRVRQQVE